MAAVGQHFCLPRVLSTAALLVCAITLTPRANSRQAENQSEPHYVGAQACAGCHADVDHEWLQSRHSKMVQPATPHGVVGDFSKGVVELRGSKYTLERQGSSYYITEDYLRGTPWKHRIEYTLGNRRIQHYLTTLPDGRIILMPATWDNVRKQWFHNADINDPEEAPGVQIQLWNKTCYSCHVSGEEKHFDLRNETYHTTWQNFGISCERCHGPGSEHVAWAEGAGTLDANTRAILDASVVNFKQMSAMRSTMVCAQCHSFRDIYVDGFRAGANYFDYFMPVMQYRLPDKEDPAYWVDGRTRRFSNDAFGLWQSQCFLKGGATCVTCHSRPHNTNVDVNPQLRPTNNALCTNCHGEIGKNVAAHTHHAVNSAGSSCVDCHMPRTVLSIKAQIRDHSMSVPAPENTISHGIPNACNECHKDKDARWESEQMNKWYGPPSGSRQKLIQRADAFAQAREGDPAAVPALLEIGRDPFGGPLVRANAVGYLGNYPDDRAAYDAVAHAISDSDPLVRATAIMSMKPHGDEREAFFDQVVPMLGDSVRTVQINAAIALVALGVKELPGKAGAEFERAKQLYRARAELNSDDPQQDVAAGKFFYLSGDFDHSVTSFRAALKLDHTIPAQYYLARALFEKRDFKSARDVLQTIGYNDAQYPSAQRLLAEIASAETAGQPSDASDAQARFNSGQLLYRNGNFGGALKDLDNALRQAPDAAWATKAQVYRAVCLLRLGRVPEAEAAMKRLSGKDLAGDELDLQLAVIELLSETGRVDDALKRAAELASAYPRNGVAQFWHAKLLLQVHQPDEAVKAAEESVRLLPDYAAAHNLLIRIYQMQGRTKEAALQAEWLRDYQRRNESH